MSLGICLRGCGWGCTINGMERCAFCSRVIAVNESPFIWQDQIACRECWEVRMAHPESSRAVVPPPPSNPAKKIRPVRVPEYGGLQILCAILDVLAVLTAVVGVGRALWTLDQHTEHPNEAIILFLGGFVGGAIVYGFSQLLSCVRDMAINSFHVRNQTT